MENELEIKRVPFMGAELMAARDTDGQIWAGVSYICNGIGLNKNEKDRQVKNVQADRVLKKGCVKFDAGVFDPNNQTVAIKLDFVPLWLAKISITPTMQAEAPYLAERLEAYQLQAKDILAAAFLPVNSVPALDTLSPELRLLINLELKQKEQDKAIEAVNQKVDGIRDVVVLSPNSWREECRKLRAELEQVKRERDAAIESIPHECDTCVYYTVSFNGCTPDYDCINPDGGCSNNYDRWQWRGPEEG